MRLTGLLLLLMISLSVPADTAGIYVDSQVVCEVVPGADPDTVASQIGGVVSDGIAHTDIYLFRYFGSSPVDTIVQLLIDRSDVRHAQPNYLIHLNLDQVSQPFVDVEQTNQAFVDGISPASYFGQYAEGNLLIDSAHLLNRGEDAVIAVIDGGLDDSHPLFAGRLHPASFDFIENEDQPWVYDGITGDHGTFVAGVAARAAPDASLMIIRCFRTSGIGTSISIAHGIFHAARNGADVINMSFSTDFYDAAISEAITAAYSQYGTMLVSSSGNYGDPFERFPGSHPYVMNIAAVDSADIKADFSNYGYTISASAPGVDVYSALTGGTVWGWWCGTSFAAPFVSGLAALLSSVYPGADPQFITDLIVETADDIDGVNPDYLYMLGSGRINFLQASFIPGDANASGEVNLGDVVSLVTYIFKGGEAPLPPEAGDFNCDGQVNVADAVFFVDYVFNDGPPPDHCR